VFLLLEIRLHSPSDSLYLLSAEYPSGKQLTDEDDGIDKDSNIPHPFWIASLYLHSWWTLRHHYEV
jgi:hypothetical protein